MTWWAANNDVGDGKPFSKNSVRASGLASRCELSCPRLVAVPEAPSLSSGKSRLRWDLPGASLPTPDAGSEDMDAPVMMGGGRLRPPWPSTLLCSWAVVTAGLCEVLCKLVGLFMCDEVGLRLPELLMRCDVVGLRPVPCPWFVRCDEVGLRPVPLCGLWLDNCTPCTGLAEVSWFCLSRLGYRGRQDKGGKHAGKHSGI